MFTAAKNTSFLHNVITQPLQPIQQSAQETSPTKKKTQTAMDPNQELDTTDETAITHSQMTKSMKTQNKFAEIEASIRCHQQAVTQHQADLTAADVKQLTEQTTEQLTALRNEKSQETTFQAQAQHAGFVRMMTLIQQLTEPPLTQPTALASWQA